MTKTVRDEGYAIVGGGAIGGTLAVHLAKNHVPVQIVDSDPDHVEAINKHGLRIETPEGVLTAHIPAVMPESGPDELGAVLLAVKSHANDAALRWIAPRLARSGWVASLQNGLNEATIAASVGEERTVAAFVDLFADVIGPGVVKDGGHGTIAMGEYITEKGQSTGRAADSQRVRQLADDLAHWGSPVVSGNVSGYLWSKVAFGSILVGTSLQDEDMSVLVERHRSLWTVLVREVIEVAQNEGIRLESFDAFEPDRYLPDAAAEGRDASIDQLVVWLEGQSKKRSGVWRDLAVRKRPTEVPYQYRRITEIAEQHGVAVPVLRKLIETIQELESGTERMGPHLIKQLETVAGVTR